MQILGNLCLNKRQIGGSGSIVLRNSKISTPLQVYPKIENFNSNNNSVINDLKNNGKIISDQTVLKMPSDNEYNYKMSDKDNRLRVLL